MDYYRIKEFSELTSVTTRTLHYYDEINLLKPSYKTNGGHRLYSDEDVLRLQQITILKHFGFSLEEINKIICKSNFNLEKSLRTQAKILADELVRIDKATTLLQTLIYQLDAKQSVDLKTITETINLIQTNQAEKQCWYDKHLTSNELADYEEIGNKRSKEFWIEYTRRWEVLFKQVEDNLESDPEGPVGLMLARRWLDLKNEVYQDHQALSDKVWEGYKSGIIPEDHPPYNMKVVEYITVAIEKLLALETIIFDKTA